MTPIYFRLFAIDPGPEESGWVKIFEDRVYEAGVTPNEVLLDVVNGWSGVLAIEMIQGMGMAVGQTTFDTCVWIGRFQQAYGDPGAVQLVSRREVRKHLCGNGNAKDPNVRQALLDIFPRTGGGAVPQIGTKKQPGPLYGVKSHAWSALGVAMTALERFRPGERL